MCNEATTDDAKTFGADAWVYCRSHLRPHDTGWCTVPVDNKVLLEAKTEDEAYAECEAKGFK